MPSDLFPQIRILKIISDPVSLHPSIFKKKRKSLLWIYFTILGCSISLNNEISLIAVLGIPSVST
jgi:hypothetical protein